MKARIFTLVALIAIMTLYAQRAAAETHGLPKAFSLAQNMPNPFNPSTTINYQVPEGKGVDVTIKVYSLRGALVRILVNEFREAGSYHVFWGGKDGNGRELPSGVYFYRMQAEKFSQIRKMVLLK